MIFERYAIEQVPYGANLILSLSDSNIKSKITGSGIEFITSHLTNTSMTFKYTEKNGTLVKIDTNLKSTLNTSKKTFTLTDTTDRKNSGEKPYIRLCCNNVKVPISFVNTDNNGNKWYESIVNDNDIIIRGWGDEKTQIKIARYAIVNWNKSQAQKIFLEKNTSHLNGEYYACQAQFSYKDNNQIKDDVYRIWSDSTIPPNGEITIPRLDGVSSNLKAGNNTLTKNFYLLFILGIQAIVSDGWETYQSDTRYYIQGTNKIYNNTDFIKTISGKKYLKVNNGFPSILTESELQFKWNSDFFFTVEDGDEEYYISPSSSQIYSTFGILNNCSLFCGVNCPNNSHAECNKYYYNKTTYTNCPGYECKTYFYCTCNNFGELNENYGCRVYNECSEVYCDSYSGCDEFERSITNYNWCECNKGYAINDNYYDCYRYKQAQWTVYCPCWSYSEYLINNVCTGYCRCDGNNQEDFCPWYICSHEEEPCPEELGYCDPYEVCSDGEVTDSGWVCGTYQTYYRVGRTSVAKKIYKYPGGPGKNKSYSADDSFQIYAWAYDSGRNSWYETIEGWITASNVMILSE